MPANKQETTNRAKTLQAFLLAHPGVKWETRVHENLGWHYSCSYGSLNVSQHARSYGNGGFMIMNGARGNGYGHIELNSYNCKTGKELIVCIKKSLDEQKEFTQSFITGYNLNSKIEFFSPLTESEKRIEELEKKLRSIKNNAMRMHRLTDAFNGEYRCTFVPR